jgi:hypothetical protein
MIYFTDFIAFRTGTGCAGYASKFLARGATDYCERGVSTAFEETAEEIGNA